MPNPLSGSFFPLSAGSAVGSTPKCQSAQVSLTETIILKAKLMHTQLINASPCIVGIDFHVKIPQTF